MFDAPGPDGRLLQTFLRPHKEGIIISSAPDSGGVTAGTVRTACPGGAGASAEPWTVLPGGGAEAGGTSSAAVGRASAGGGEQEGRSLWGRKKSGSRQSSRTGAALLPCLPHSGSGS